MAYPQQVQGDGGENKKDKSEKACGLRQKQFNW